MQGQAVAQGLRGSEGLNGQYLFDVVEDVGQLHGAEAGVDAEVGVPVPQSLLDTFPRALHEIGSVRRASKRRSQSVCSDSTCTDCEEGSM